MNKDSELNFLNTQATNPTNLSVNKLQWIKFRPLWASIWIIGLVYSGYLTYQYGGFHLLHTLFFLFANWFYWWIINRKFRGGDFNFGKVISLSPTLIAVSTNMAKSAGQKYPAVAVIKTKLTKIGGRQLVLGDYVAVIGLYFDFDKESFPFWEKFVPFPVYEGYTDVKVIDEKLKKIKNDYTIDTLEDYLKDVPKPYAIGTYRVKKNETDWVKF